MNHGLSLGLAVMWGRVPCWPADKASGVLETEFSGVCFVAKDDVYGVYA